MAWIQWDALPAFGALAGVVILFAVLGNLGERSAAKSGERWRKKLSEPDGRSSSPDA